MRSLLLLAFLTTTLHAAEGESLNIVSFNIRYENSGDGLDGWKHRREAVVKFLADKHDLAGLQEVTAAQWDYLREKLPQFEFLGVGRNDGKRGGEFTPLLIRKDRFEVIDSGTFWLSETPDKVGSQGWDAALPRICTWAKLKTKTTPPRELFFANTHFDHRGVKARAESAKLLRTKLAELAGELPALLTGDFNCLAKDEPYSVLTAKDDKLVWDDAAKTTSKPHVGPDSTWNGFKAIEPGQKIDFIFVRKIAVTHHEIRDERIGERFLSDHLPVLMTAKLEP